MKAADGVIICPCCRRAVELAKAVDVCLTTSVVSYQGKTLKVPPRQAELIVLLAQSYPRPMKTTDLIYRMWGLAEPGHPPDNIYCHVYRLRKVLGKIGLSLVSFSGRGYALGVADNNGAKS